MNKMYYLIGSEWIQSLAEQGYKWASGQLLGNRECICERMIIEDNANEKKYTSIITLDLNKKEVRIFPAEIYAEGSPTANKEKLDKILSMCGDLEDLIKDIKEERHELYYKFEELSPLAKQRAINDYHNALIANGAEPYADDEKWGLEEDLKRYKLDYYANGKRYEE